MTDRVSFLDLASIDALTRRLKIDPHRVRRARVAYFKKSLDADAALAELPTESRQAFAAAVTFEALTDIRRFDSQIDGASKLISRTAAGYAIETVILRPTTGRTALCVSSQVGCAAACAFCATGQMGVAKSLSAAEILDQVVQANRLLAAEDRRVRNIVFMGMGEPLHNEAALHETLATLQASHSFDHPPSRTLVSTVGVPEPLLRTAERFPTVNFALSLHAASQATRETIIPLAKRYSLDVLRSAVEQLNRLQPQRSSVMIEYLMLDGVNDSQDDAALLLDWVQGLRVHVNLIPFNPIATAPHLKSSPRPTIEAFGAQIRNAGHPTTIRYSLGRDIDAACGQLVRDENLAIAKALRQVASQDLSAAGP
jgi:23S rRNA (adenine2503-C2)-methyltransferase